MNNIFGKYRYRESFMYKLDARVKFLALIFLMIMCFLPYGRMATETETFGYFTNNFIIIGILFVIVTTLMLISKVSILDFLKQLKAFWFMMIFLFIINVFLPYNWANPHVAFLIYNYPIYYESIFNTLFIIFRLILMVEVTMILTTTTSPMDITFAMEWYLTPLKYLRIPTQVFSMTMSLALRFVPTLLDESRRIMKAQKSRGVDYNKGFITKKVKAITTLIVPLFASCFQWSDDLALAMDARGYDPYGKRSRYRVLKSSYRDVIGIIFIILSSTFFISMCVLSQNFNIDFVEYLFGVTTL